MVIKILVAAAGVVLIVLINWYFLFARRRS